MPKKGLFDFLSGKVTERVLNLASHGNTIPLYEEKMRRAMQVIGQLVQVLETQQ